MGIFEDVFLIVAGFALQAMALLLMMVVGQKVEKEASSEALFGLAIGLSFYGLGITLLVLGVM